MSEVIHNTDLIHSSHSPVQDVFDYWYPSTLPWLLESLSKGVAVGAYIAGCDFISAKDFSGVHFESEYANDVTISFSDLYHYMVLASQRYLDTHPSDKPKVEKYLTDYRQRFLPEQIKQHPADPLI